MRTERPFPSALFGHQAWAGTAVSLVMCFGAGIVYGEGDPAFPDAEGFGATVKGGRGGPVVWVTNLDSHGPGSLRAAVDTKGPRTIKFKVGGTIELWRDTLDIGGPFETEFLRLRKEGKPAAQIENPYSFVTIDGSSAPPPGITISGNVILSRYGFKEVILRHLRIRDNGFISRSNACCIQIFAGRVLIDHCSLQYGRDTITDMLGNQKDITLQWCILGPGWGRHGYGVGIYAGNVTVHHCLFAHNAQRNPVLFGNHWEHGDGTGVPHLSDIRNNVMYNWDRRGAAKIYGGAHVNIINNWFIPGPDSVTRGEAAIRIHRTAEKPHVLYLKGNISANRPKDDMDEWADAGHETNKPTGTWHTVYGPFKFGQKRESPFAVPPVKTHSVAQAKDLVLSQAGALPRDPTDAGVVRTVLNRSGSVKRKNALPSDFANAIPTAKVVASLVKDAEPRTVSFEGAGQDADGKILLHTWHFGDGNRAVGKKVTHLYKADGEYLARLFIVDDQGMSTSATLRLLIGRGSLKTEAMPAPAPTFKERVITLPEYWKAPTVSLGKRLTAPPTEQDWIGAPHLTPFIDQRTWLLATDVPPDKRGLYYSANLDSRVLHDGEKLYVRFIYHDMPTKSVYLTLFLSPQHGKSPWYRLETDLNGQRSSEHGPDQTWKPSPDWSVHSKVTGKRWEALVAIPFEAIAAPPRKGDEWGLKLMVYAKKNVIFLWPPLGPGGRNLHLSKNQFCAPHSSEPAYYARLRFP